MNRKKNGKNLLFTLNARDDAYTVILIGSNKKNHVLRSLTSYRDDCMIMKTVISWEVVEVGEEGRGRVGVS